MTVVTVREATLDDAHTIALVHVRTWQVAYAHVFPAAELRNVSVEARTERWREGLASPRAGDVTFVAVDDSGAVVGFASIGRGRDEPVEIGELYAIYVSPKVWGAGIGQRLMAHALSRLRAERFREAILWVLDDNPRSRRFYELAGWSHDGGARTGEHLGVQASEVRYRIDLRP